MIGVILIAVFGILIVLAFAASLALFAGMWYQMQQDHKQFMKELDDIWSKGDKE